MTTLDCTIDQLQETRKETGRVIEHSRKQAPRGSDVLYIVRGIFSIRRKWGRLVSDQSKSIQVLTAFDFTKKAINEIEELAESIESVVKCGRELLAETNGLGAEIRFWWRRPMQEFAEQIEHLDSIAESLRLECEPDVVMLLASAISNIASDPRSAQDENSLRVR